MKKSGGNGARITTTTTITKKEVNNTKLQFQLWSNIEVTNGNQGHIQEERSKGKQNIYDKWEDNQKKLTR